MKKLRVLLSILCFTFVFMMTGEKNLAYNGSGTSSDPYLISTYEELACLTRDNSASETTMYYKLVKDISPNPNYPDPATEIMIGKMWPYYEKFTTSSVVLDLNGHSMSRIGGTSDKGMFHVASGTLEILDSKGGGTVDCQLLNGQEYCPVIFCEPAIKYGQAENIIIRGGSFNTASYAKGDVIYEGCMNGTITIDGGTFGGKIEDVNYDGARNPTNYIINGGTFTNIIIWGRGSVLIKDCRAQGIRGQRYMSNVIASDSVVYVDGEEVTDLYNIVSLYGDVLISDPSVFRVLKGPQSRNDVAIGERLYFTVTAQQAKDYEWYFIDKYGDVINAIELKEANLGIARGYTSETLRIDDLSPILSGSSLYCRVTGPDGSKITTEPAQITFQKKVSGVYVEIANLEKAVSGANVKDFMEAKVVDYAGKVLPYATAEVSWYLFNKKLEDYELYAGEAMSIRVEVNLKDGYEFADERKCAIRNVNGEDAYTVWVTSPATATYTPFVLERGYVVQAPAGGIKIPVISETLTVPVVGEALSTGFVAKTVQQARLAKYTVTSFSWSPADETFQDGKKYVLTVTFQANPYYGFFDGTTVMINGKEVDVLEIIDGEEGTITARYTYDFRDLIANLDMHRLYNPNTGEHFYTASTEERDNLTALGWQYEGVAWRAPERSNTPVYRLFNPNSGEHHYTMSAEERDTLVGYGWNFEGIGWYSDDSKSVPLYRLYNPNAVGQFEAGAHHYTSSQKERDDLIAIGWNYEGIGWYGVGH